MKSSIKNLLESMMGGNDASSTSAYEKTVNCIRECRYPATKRSGKYSSCQAMVNPITAQCGPGGQETGLIDIIAIVNSQYSG